MGIGNEKVHTTIHKVNKLQGYTLQHREYSQYLIIDLEKF